MANSRNFSGLFIFILIIAAAAGGWFYWKSRAAKTPEFYTAKVTRGAIIQAVTATGVIQPVVDVLVSSQISGYINSLAVDFNSKVKKGDLLATLLPTNYQAAVKSAEADLANAQANHKINEINLARDKELLAKNLLAQSDYDTEAALTDEAAAQVAAKTAALEMARTNLSYCDIRSPIDGIVIKRAVDIGNSVAATLNSPTLFEIGNDLTKMQIDAAVAEADIGNVAESQAVNFSVDAYPNRQFRGKVRQIRNAPQTQQNVVIYDVMIDVDNSDLKLKPGMTANASIVIASRPNALRLPNSALRFRMPENLAPSVPAETKSAASPGPAPKQLSADERRTQIRELMQEAGFTPGAGPPSPQVIQKMQALAKERGIELPERMAAGGGGGNAAAPVVRTIYRLPAGNPPGAPEAVRVKVGITDGTDTEVLDGLKEGDLVITGINQPGASASGPSSSPFGGGNRTFGGGFGR